MKTFGKPETRFEFLEPVSIFKTLRRIRLLLPIPIDGTPDERPLELQDLRTIQREFRTVSSRYFGAATRVARFLLTNGNFELSAPWRRTLYETAANIDHFLLQRLKLRRLASNVVIVAQG